MIIKSIHVFDWDRQTVLAWVREDERDFIKWLPMAEVYCNPQEAILPIQARAT